MFQNISIRFLQLLGYDPAATLCLDGRDLAHLASSGVAVLVGALVSGCGGAYLVSLGVSAGAWRPCVVAAAFIVVFLFAINMRRMLITAGGCSYAGSLFEVARWRPDNLRLLCVLFLALLFAQPLLLQLQRERLDQGVLEKARVTASLYRSAQLSALDRQRDQLLRRTALVDEDVQLLGLAPPLPPATLSEDISSSTLGRRHALVISADSDRQRNLPSKAPDVRSVQDLLSSMGFRVTTLKDPTQDEMWLAIDHYLKSLHAGDVSVVYFRGNIDQRTMQPKLFASDAQPGKISGVSVAQLMEDVIAKSVRASLVLLDGAGATGEQAPRSNKALTVPRSTLLLISDPAGWTKVRTDDLFVRALLHHLGRGERVSDVIRAVAAELSAAGRPPFLASTLSTEYQQLSATVIANHPPFTGLGRHFDDKCAAATLADMPVVKTCMLDTRTRLRAQLAANQQQRGSALDKKVLAYRESILRSGMVRERWHLAWTRPWLCLACMLFCVLLMTAGDLWRDIQPRALRQYEIERARLARQMVEHTFAGAKTRVNTLLQQYPAPFLPGLRWHELRSYFDMHVPSTPWRTSSFEPHGSKSELLDRLAWQETVTEGTA